MNTGALLELAAGAAADRVAVGSLRDGLTYGGLLDRARRIAAVVTGLGAERVVAVAQNSPLMPALLYGSGLAGVPFVPVNYRLADAPLRAVLTRAAPGLAVVDDDAVGRVAGVEDLVVLSATDFLARVEDADSVPAPAPAPASASGRAVDPDAIAVLLYTSGTTGAPKAAVLRHRHLAAYVTSMVEFMASGEEHAALVSVPPYHVAAVITLLTSLYGGRRLVFLPHFDPQRWVDLAIEEGITHAFVVPTMLGRILDVLEARGEKLPRLVHLACGGGRMPLPVIERALVLLPAVGFVNAYGLTETAATVTMLRPEDHRLAFESDDPAVRARLGSVGRPLPSVELEIRGPDGRVLPAGERGEIYVRGAQVAGEYLGRRALTADGWFPTNDAGWLDDAGFLFVEGRLDDVIVRGGENLSPGEIEDVLVTHPAIAEAGVIGIPDEEWGETVAAAVVLKPGAEVTVAELQHWVRARLRSSRTPTVIDFRTGLPYNETGKLLRRVLRTELAHPGRAGRG